VSGLQQRVLLAPDDGSLGPLLRVSDDVLASGAGYGVHEHRAVDVVAVVLAGSLRHRWGDGARLGAGDVAVLRAGAGLEHDEIAGDDGARVLQCYLRAALADVAPAHEVHRHPSGWVDLGRDDARVWVAGGAVDVPAGVLIPLDDSDLRVVWEVAAERPEWARG
jgi:redox-sensitive bicupin YhaK (pirin superfamily)